MKTVHFFSPKAHSESDLSNSVSQLC